MSKESKMDSDAVTKAISVLSQRVANLERNASSAATPSGDGEDLRPVLNATMENLKALRTEIIRGSSEVEVQLKELASVKEENEKLKYQIKHLKRSLEAAENG